MARSGRWAYPWSKIDCSKGPYGCYLKRSMKPDFLPASYGYRPGTVGLQQAVKDLTFELQFGRFGYVVEADIKGFFDAISWIGCCKMLEERIDDDKPFLGLIDSWLKAGILERDGTVIHPMTGTPQGGVVSPILANIYLHYVLDLWFERVVKPHCQGQAHIIRFADDFVCSFQYRKRRQKPSIGSCLNGWRSSACYWRLRRPASTASVGFIRGSTDGSPF